MKFMRLGSKPDCFTTRGNHTTVKSDLVSDIIMDVDGHKFHLHLFPLLAKCGALHKIISETLEAGEDDVEINDFPGGAECFEICAKFCYGVAVTINAHNVSAVRCGAEFLKMTESVEQSNLIHKLEVFLNTSIYRGWKDSIICIQNCKDHQPWAEDLKIISRCIESISSKVMVDPAKVDWSFSYTRDSSAVDHVSISQHKSPAIWNGASSSPWQSPVPKDWWVEDLCDLDIDVFCRVMVAVKAKGVARELVGEALRVYALRWLPGISDDQALFDNTRMISTYFTDDVEEASKHKQVLETIVGLLPTEKGSCSCSFLLKLLKASTILNASTGLRMELARRIGSQLEEATLRDLLIPSLSYANGSMYDIDVVMRIVEYCLLESQNPTSSPESGKAYEIRRTRSAENFDLIERRDYTASAHNSMFKVAKLIDGYLAEISRDPSLSLEKFMRAAEFVPDCARPFHDGLYRAIDMYLKEHPELTKREKKRICTLMDCRKLSIDASMHAIQNERLPLRTVVQVLMHEQVRTAAASGRLLVGDITSNIRALLAEESSDDQSLFDMRTDMIPSAPSAGGQGWGALHHEFSTLKCDLAVLETRIAEAEKDRTSLTTDTSSKSLKSGKSVLSRPKRFFQKLFSKKVSNSASSIESARQSPMPTLGSCALVPQRRRGRRHSMS